MKKKYFRLLSLAFFILGILFLLNSKIDITGAVVGVSSLSSGFSSIFGIVLILVSVVLFVGGESLEERTKLSKSKYYKERVKEIFDLDYDRQDVWVSRWELDGIMGYIKDAKDVHGNLEYPYSEFEHDKDTPTIHPYGIHKILHIHAKIKDKSGNIIRRHLLITNDPYDPRLRTVGVRDSHYDLVIRRNKGVRKESKVYSPKHPRYNKKVYKRKVCVGRMTYTMYNKGTNKKN